MRILFLIIALFVWSTEMSWAAGAKENACVTSSEILELNRDFEITSEIFWDPCDTENVNHKVMRALLMLKNGQFEGSHKSSDQIFSNTINSANSPYKFIKNRVRKIKILKTCEGSFTVAYVNKRKFPSTIFVCGDASASLADYLSVAVHEARHLDTEDTSHKVCLDGMYKGLEACDGSFEDRGAYHYDIQAKVMVGKFGKNFHPALKAYALSSAITDLQIRFNKVPRLNGKKISILKDRRGRLFHLDGLLRLTPRDEVLAGRLVDARNGSFVVLNGDGESVAGMGSFHAHLGLLADEPVKYSVTDMISNGGPGSSYGNIANGRVLNYVLSGETLQRKKGHLDLDFQAERFLEWNLCDAGKKDHIYIKATDGRVFGVFQSPQGVISKEVHDCHPDFLKQIELEGRRLALLEDGRLLVKTGPSWNLAPGLEEHRFNFMSEPLTVLEYLLSKAR